MSDPTNDLPPGGSRDLRSFLNRFDRIQLIAVGALGVAVIIGLVIAFTAFGGSSHNANQDAGSQQIPTTAAAPTDEPASTPLQSVNTTDAAGGSGGTSSLPSGAASSSVPAVTASVGKTVMTQDRLSGICASAVPSGNPDASIKLLPGGKALIICSGSNDNSDQSQDTIVAYDLLTGQQGWTYMIPAGDHYVVGTKHLVEVATVDHPAKGLSDKYITYTLTAVDLSTGNESWTVPFESWVKAADRQTDNTPDATEGSSGDRAHPADIVMSLVDTSAFDANTGQLLWHVPSVYESEASGSYVDSGVVVVDGGVDSQGDTLNDYGAYFTGISARTGKIVWNAPAEEWLDDNPNDAYYGDTLVIWVDSGYKTINLVTGKILRVGRFPANWRNITVYPRYVTAQVGSRLELFELGSLKSPKWSIPASSDVSVKAETPGHLLVEAPSGDVILSTADGSTTTTLSGGFDVASNGNDSALVVDGMAADSNGDVLELDPPTGQ